AAPRAPRRTTARAAGTRTAPTRRARRAPRTRTGARPRPRRPRSAAKTRRGRSNEASDRDAERARPRLHLRVGAVLSSLRTLAARTPVGRAVVVALAARADPHAAARARSPGPPVGRPRRAAAPERRAHQP